MKNLKQNPPDPNLFYVPYSVWLGLQPNWFSQIPQKRTNISIYYPRGIAFILKGFCFWYAWSCSLSETRTSFCRDVSLEVSANSYFCFWLVSLHSASYFFYLYWSPFLFLSIDDVLLTNPSANMFVFGDFNIHHKNWLTYSGGTDRPREICYNYSLSYFFYLKWPYPDGSLSYSDPQLWLTVLLFATYLFLLVLVFVWQWLSFHWEILIMLCVFIDFLPNKKNDVCFSPKLLTILVLIGIVKIILEMIHRRISFNSLLLKLLVNFINGIRLELIEVYIPHFRYQVKLH